MTPSHHEPFADQVGQLIADLYRSHDGLSARAVALADAAAAAGNTRWADLARLVVADVDNRNGRADEGVTLARRVLSATEDRVVRAHAHAVVSGGLWRVGDNDRAVRHALQAMRMLEEGDPLPVRADHALVLAAMVNAQRPGRISTEEFEVAQALAEASGQPSMIIVNLNNWAWCACAAGDLTTARAMVARLQACAESTGTQLSSSVADTVARVLLESGEFDEAERMIVYAAEQAPTTDSDAIPAALITLAEIQYRDGDWAGGLRTLDRCRAIAARNGVADTAVAALRQIAVGQAGLGDFEAAYRTMVEFHDAWTLRRSQQSELVARFAHAQFAVEEFRALAERDPLTGLPNRRGFDAGLQAALAAAEPVCVALVDLDHFKQVNDTYSHAVGDDVLRSIADLLGAVPGVAGRQGGEEFVLMLRSGLDDAVRACERLRHAVEAHEWQDIAAGLSVTASIGVAEIRPGEEPSEAMGRADALLYAAKREGRNRVRA
ncbi:GGDEF domain-containing protein [Catenuloplanes japonicus]|uniref:GGDEF domain-containing protein n=1 Tax=Catenuloplanes japonicus TaxID=33876 RepID=UPI000525EDE2|nr:GGDEF domain-containing protein [Catenuloplanes japonicus]